MTDAADITGQRNEFTTAFNMVVPPAAPKPDDPYNKALVDHFNAAYKSK